MIRKFAPESSKATPLRSSYMDRAVNEAKSLRTNVISSGNEWPAFTAKAKWSKKGEKMR